MADRKLTITVQDSPYESETTTTVLRIAEAALRKGIDVTVFAYEGAVALPFKGQAPHANPVKGTTVEQQEHSLHVFQSLRPACLALDHAPDRLRLLLDALRFHVFERRDSRVHSCPPFPAESRPYPAARLRSWPRAGSTTTSRSRS